MEKKQYIEPSMIIKQVNITQQILAGSITIDLGDGETIGGDGGEGDGSDAAAKDLNIHSVWED